MDTSEDVLVNVEQLTPDEDEVFYVLFVEGDPRSAHATFDDAREEIIDDVDHTPEEWLLGESRKYRIERVRDHTGDSE